MNFVIKECDLGLILIATNSKGICAIYLGDDPKALTETLQKQFPKMELLPGNNQTNIVLMDVLNGLTGQHNLQLDIQGTPFQQKVWQALQQIPPGTVVSYSDIAKKIGSPKSVRAVAGACAANKLAILIPCHRVVKSDGQISGYRWGIHRKKALIEKERSLVNV